MTFGPVQFLLYSADAFMTTLFNTVAQRCHTQSLKVPEFKTDVGQRSLTFIEQSGTYSDFKQEKKKAKRLQQTFSLFK